MILLINHYLWILAVPTYTNRVESNHKSISILGVRIIIENNRDNNNGAGFTMTGNLASVIPTGERLLNLILSRINPPW